MNIKTALAICVMSFMLSAAPSQKNVVSDLLKSKELELEKMRDRLEQAQDSLQNEIAFRWNEKQRFIHQRESDKETVDQLRESLERSYSELSQVKEEGMIAVQTLEEEKKNLTEKKEEWAFITSTQKDIYSKQADDLKECIPIEMDGRRVALEKIRNKFKSNESSYASYFRFLEYKRYYIDRGLKLNFETKTVLTENEGTQLLNLICFGNVFAYGSGENGQFYFINQTGRLGEARYSIDKVAAPKFLEFLQNALPVWVKNKQVTGSVMLDIMQNSQSKELLAGTKISPYQKFYLQLKAGGAVMIPLLLLPVWALILTLIKLIQFGSKKRIHRKVYRTVTQFIDKNDNSGALQYLKKQKTPLARIFEQYLLNLSWDRNTAEKCTQEHLLEAVPKLNTFINTLAVMAGAAPLLGLLGTISGMINLFAAVTYHGTGDPKFLAGGISEALITAKTGLGIAIPLLFIHDYLRNKKDHIVADLELFSVRLLNRFWLKK